MNRTIFIGVRSGSTRSLNKNTKAFLPDGTSLLENRILQAREVSCDEIIISTNCPICRGQASSLQNHDNRIKVIKRPQDLCKNTTLVSDIMKHIADAASNKTIMWTHVTSPFICPIDMNNAFKIFEEKNKFDSVVSVNKIQNFIWHKSQKKVINNLNKNNKWPNTQDLFPLYEINHAFYVCSSDLLKKGERVGKNPFLYECEGESRLDIDYEQDFAFGQLIAKNSKKTRLLNTLNI